jgi:aspartate carbamoyltransferase catalytic subunit
MPPSNDRSMTPAPESRNPSASRSLLDTRSLSAVEITKIFEHADQLKALGDKHGNFFEPQSTIHRKSALVCLLFFEPSTRTRMSFQAAAYRMGHQVLTMDLLSGSSLAKGETYSDTILNVAAMEPDIMVVRYGKSPELDRLLPGLPMPIINGGSGVQSHPTQALLDAYTIRAHRGELTGQRVLIVGDIIHSRVARSNFDVLTKLGAEIGVCGPKSLLPNENEVPGLRLFHDLDQAIGWATVYMALRIQLERHDSIEGKRSGLDQYRQDYVDHFGLNRTRLKTLSKDAMIMHPGPINYGVELPLEIQEDPRSRILEQVTNGVLIRSALLSRALGEMPG